MILRGPTLNPLCRQCGHELDRPLTRCPMCGMRTGLVPPLRASARPTIEDGDASIQSREYEELSEIDSEEEDLVLAPPLERPPQTPLSLDAVVDEEPPCELDDAPAPIPRSITLGSLMLGTLLIAICLGIGRASAFVGVVAFLVLIPAFIRTLSAISYYRDRGRQLGAHDLGTIFAMSLVLALMGLLAGGFMYGMVAYAGGKIAQAMSWDDSMQVTTYVATAAAFVAVTWVIHKAWPANED